MTGDEAAVTKLDEMVAQARPIGLSALTVTEVEVGLPDRRTETFEQVIEEIDVYPYDLAEARRAARIQRLLQDAGERIGVVDSMIGATALERGRGVVTRNVSEFRRIDDLRVVPY